MTSQYRNIAVAFSVGLATLNCAVADPVTDLGRALNTAGNAQLTALPSSDFIAAFTAVLVRTKSRDLAGLVRAAIQLRPDIRNDIVVAALDVRTNRVGATSETRRRDASRIVRGALEAPPVGPNAATSLILAAINNFPDYREAIASGSAAVVPTQNIALVASAGHSAGFAGEFRGIGQGADFANRKRHHGRGDDDGGGDEVSPEKPPRL